MSRYLQDLNLAGLNNILEQEQQRWFLWVPVCLGAGIAAYFSAADEPGWSLVIAFFITGTGFVVMGSRYPLGLVLSGLVFWMSVGAVLAKVRTTTVSAPVMGDGTGTVTVFGWPETVQRLPSGGFRIVLRVHEMQGRKNRVFSRKHTPHRVRLSLKQKNTEIRIGELVKLRAMLRPPPQPVWPGGFDFARTLWFERIGGVGFALSVPEPPGEEKYDRISPPLVTRLLSVMSRIRDNIRTVILDTLPGKSGPLAAALITGDRSGIDEKDLQALRDSGLAHILAISGLHMAIMAGTIYWFLRWVLAAFPVIALKFPIKRIAAIVALSGGAGYLLLSGASVSTQRAFIMTSVVFCSILLDRPGISLRNVALSALVILIIRPESLLDVGFQMSFAAVTALVAIYELIAETRERKKIEGQIITPPVVLPVRYLGGIATTTVIAGLAVAPVAAFHFHKVTLFSLLGNVLAMPLIGLLIMPMALLFLVLLPFGLASLPLKIMQVGLDWLMGIAGFVSSLPGASQAVPQMPMLALALMVLGGLWLAIWQHQWRFWGLIVIAAGILLTPAVRLPDLLVDGSGRIVAAVNPGGVLAASGFRGGDFSLSRWLQIYGDSRTVAQARADRLFRCDTYGCLASVKGLKVGYLKHPLALNEDCEAVAILVSGLPVKRECRSARLVIDRRNLERFGAHAIYINDGAIIVDTVFNHRYGRPWAGTRTDTFPRKLRD